MTGSDPGFLERGCNLWNRVHTARVQPPLANAERLPQKNNKIQVQICVFLASVRSVPAISTIILFLPLAQ
jgi:hypothetical protein